MLTRWSDIDRSFAGMDEFRRRIDRLFEEFDGGAANTSPRAVPPMNFYDQGSRLVLTAEVPGLSEKELKLSLQSDLLTVEGERKVRAPEGYSLHRQERASYQFSRSVSLPCKVDPDSVSASVKNGVLTITLNKAPESRPRQIAVSANG